MDVKLHGKDYRILAIYVPHAGYSVNEYENCLDDFRNCVLDGQRNGRKCMVGGDFNTDLLRGWRGDRLRELLLEVHLENSTSETNATFEDLWTFRSCLGQKRILDYCFVPSEITVQSSSSTDRLNLGSDHRCV